MTTTTDAVRKLAEALAWRNDEGRINSHETLLHHWMDMNNVVAALLDFWPETLHRATGHHTVPIAERLKASDDAFHRVEQAAVQLVRELVHEERKARLRAELLAADGDN
jgi:hypothetical protein